MTPKVTLSLMVTNAEELATMLAVLNQHERGDTDLAKQARSERDDAIALSIGWQRSAEEAQQRFIEATQHAESLAEQLERAEATVKRLREAEERNKRARAASRAETDQEIDRLTKLATEARADARDARIETQRATAELEAVRTSADHLRDERDDLSVLLADANELLDGGKNQPVTAATNRAARHQARVEALNDQINPPDPISETIVNTGAAHARELAERRRLLGNVADINRDPARPWDKPTADVVGDIQRTTHAYADVPPDLHPDEDTHA